MFGPGGFRSERDIMAITVNRWAHGYTYYHHTLWDGDVPEEDRIHVVSRKRFGNIAIANTDAGGDAQLPFAIEQAHRATDELLRGA
jgi:spermidine dehydrogenase